MKFDGPTFERIKGTIKSMSATYKERLCDTSYACAVPEDVGIQLTNRCNLRCRHCFQWSDEGFFRDMSKSFRQCDIDIALVKSILDKTKEAKSNLYLWGGEPLCYDRWDELCGLLENDPRWTVLCTNGILIDKKIESINKISANLAVMVSVDGFENENDGIRGKGTFKKAVENTRLLLDLKKQGVFKGEVTVNCVISEAMIGKLYDFMEFFESMGLSTVYFCFPWYIPETTAEKMDVYFKEHFADVFDLKDGAVPSWHSYTYRLGRESIPKLIEELKRIEERVWKVRIRLQPALELDEIEGFVTDSEAPAQARKACLAISTRMNVMATGDVTACKLFPEFTVGSLKNQTLKELWHGDAFEKCRKTIGCGLMPVCSKCVLLYLHGV